MVDPITHGRLACRVRTAEHHVRAEMSDMSLECQGRDLAYYLELARETGFEVLSERQTGQHVFMDLQKH
jgi:hypothetical protein